MTDLSPASQKLLRELARRDKGDGVAVRYAGRDRWHLAGISTDGLYSTRTFPALCAAGLAVGWDEYGDSPLRITEAGQKVAAALETQAAERQAAKKARSKPNPDGAAARRLLREIAKCGELAPVHDDGLRRLWSLSSCDGYRASIDTWMALPPRLAARDFSRKSIALLAAILNSHVWNELRA